MQQLQHEQAEQSDTDPAGSPPKRRAWRPFFFVVALAGATAGAWHFWPVLHQSQQPRDAGAARATTVTVRTDAVTRGAMPVVLNALGTVTSLTTVTVKTQISGKITEIGFKEGQMVGVGDFLAQIDARPYQAALAAAEGQLARDRAQLEAAKVDQTRYEALLKQDSIPRQQVDTQRALVRQLQGTTRSDESAVETARINLNYCRIVSPIEGRAGLRLVDLGNYVQPGDTGGVVVITKTKPISVIFSLPQDTIPQFIAKLREGKKLAVESYTRDGSQKIATGDLETIDNQIDTTTGTVKLRAMFPNEDEALFPNQFVNVKLIVDTLSDTALLPQAAVQLGAPGSYVYLVKPDNTVTVRPVKLGPGDDQRVAVLEGVSAGDQVVVDGADRLREGASIRISGAAADTNGAERPPSNGDHGDHHRTAKQPN